MQALFAPGKKGVICPGVPRLSGSAGRAGLPLTADCSGDLQICLSHGQQGWSLQEGLKETACSHWFQLPSASLKTPLPIFDGYWCCLRSKISQNLLLQRAPRGCFSCFASVSWNSSTLHECVVYTCSGLSCTAPQSLPLLLLFSQYQNYKGSSCSSECIHAAVLSARSICGRVAEGAWMSDGTEVNAAEAVGGRRRLGAGSPTIVMRSLQWCIQAQRAVRSFHSPSHWNSDCFCLGHAFVSVISGVVPWCQCFSEAHLDFPSKCAAAPMAQHILLSSLLGTHRNAEWFEL